MDFQRVCPRSLDCWIVEGSNDLEFINVIFELAEVARMEVNYREDSVESIWATSAGRP